MQDEQIISLYWERNEAAIWETEEKYGNYLTKIAYNILANREDSQECVNDTYFKAWNAMPPHKPVLLSAYLGKITRHTAIDLFRKRKSSKRQTSEYAVSLSELEECASSGDSTLQSVDMHLLAESVNTFLRNLRPKDRNIFILRYYFLDSIRDVAAYYGMSESSVKSRLHRIRIRLKKYLEQEGFYYETGDTYGCIKQY